MLAKYIVSLVAAVLIVTALASRMQFATRSQVQSGKSVDENWSLEFTLDADDTHTYRVSSEIQNVLEEGITFDTDGPVHVTSSSVSITPKDVSWTKGREHYSGPGAGLAAHVKWETPPDAANGAHGKIYISFPRVPGVLSFHSGGYEKDEQDRWILREVTTYQSPFSLFVARVSFAFAAGLAWGILAQGIFWAFQLAREKKSRIAALPPQTSQLPRVFYPNPIAEWILWTLFLGIGAVIGAMLAGFSALDGFMSSDMVWFICVPIAAGAVVALIAAYYKRASVLTVRVDADGMSYARGRGELHWVTSKWADVPEVQRKSRTYRGNRTEWLEFKFKDTKKKLKVPEDTVGYPALCEFIFSIFTPATPR